MQAASLAFEIPLAVLGHPAHPAMAANVTPDRFTGAADAPHAADALCFHGNSLARTPRSTIRLYREPALRSAGRLAEARPPVRGLRSTDPQEAVHGEVPGRGELHRGRRQ